MKDSNTGFFGGPNLTPVQATQYPPEPAIFKVVRFRVRLDGSGKEYFHTAIRADDGRWYTTVSNTRQGVSWQTLCDSVRPKLVGQFTVMTDHIGFSL